MPRRPLVISASRRTDLPGFHTEECARRIRQRESRLRTRFLHGVVFWSRHVRPFFDGGPLERLLDDIDNPFLNLTATGLGSSEIEPGVPPIEAVLYGLPALARALRGEGWRIRWRFDPLLPDGLSDLEEFERIADAMAAVGVESCTFSFPAYRSLAGDLTASFEEAGISRWREEAKAPFLARIAEIARPRGIRLLSCCQPRNLELHPEIEAAACISRELLERGHPDHLPLDLPRDPSQRTHCNCVTSEDIGRYDTDRCSGGCAYCYSKAGGPHPAAED
jgi:hypothetical protein